MKKLLAITPLIMLAACGFGGPPPPDWKTDSADLIERYKKQALLGENILAERYFQQAVAATGGAGRISDTAHLWLVHCATRRAMLIDDACSEYVDLARAEPNAADQAYYQFLTLHWDTVNIGLLPKQHRDLVSAAPTARTALLAKVDDPLARLLESSLLVMRHEADDATLAQATETASSQGWRQPLLTYLKLQEKRAEAQGDKVDLMRLGTRIQLIEQSFSPASPR